MTRRRRSPIDPLVGLAGLVGLVALAPAAARADEPLALRDAWSGDLDFVITGASLAKDTNNDNKVDAPALPGAVTVAGLPPGAALLAARLYWAASQAPSMCEDPGKLDAQVIFKPPGGAAEAVDADGCYCSIGAASYDMQLCFADVSDRVDALAGAYEVDGLDALLGDGDTHNASFSLVLVYTADGVGPRRVGLYDGLWTMVKGGNGTTSITLAGLEIDDPPQGDLAWVALEGDVNGSMDEAVVVTGMPGGKSHTPTDAINPANNPFNQTINTSEPPQTGTIGVDVDRFPISPALTAGDASVEVTYSAGLDKYWIAVNVIGVDVFEPALFPGSEKSWALTDDADGDGAPTAGDVVTYTIHLINVGNAPATLSVVDPIPAEAASWAPGALCGGALVDQADAFEVTGVELAVGESCDLTFTVVIGEVADQTPMKNTATVTLGGIESPLVAADAELRRDGDGDGHFDNDDNCPDVANPDQADGDVDGVGDACEGGDTTTTSGGETSGGGETRGSGDASGTGDSGSGTGGDTESGSASATGTTGGGASAGESEGTGDGGATSGGASGDEGCGCVSGRGRGGGPLALAFGALGLGLHRRRRGR